MGVLQTARLGFGDFYGRMIASADGNGFSIREMTDRHPGGTPRHTHEHAHFCLLLRGEYHTRTRNLQGWCPPLTLLFHPAGTTHDDYFTEQGGTSIMIAFRSGFLEEFGELPLLRHSVAFDEAALGFPGVRMHAELLEEGTGKDAVLEGLAHEMLSLATRTTPREEGVRTPWLRRARDYIHDHACDPVRVQDVAAEVGVHPVHLAREFRRHFGLSPGEQLRSVRLQTAIRQIVDSDKTLAMIAAESGFSDQSELTRTFRRYVGLTPYAYRRATRR